MSTTTPLPVWTLGELMEKARRDAGISTAQMADILNVTPKTINNYEANRTHPSRAVIMAWSSICDQAWFTLDGISDLLRVDSPWITAPADQLSLFDDDSDEEELPAAARLVA